MYLLVGTCISNERRRMKSVRKQLVKFLWLRVTLFCR